MLRRTAPDKDLGQQLQRRALRQRQHFMQETSKYGRLAGEGQEATGLNPKPHRSLRSPFCFGLREVPLRGNRHSISVPHAAEPSRRTKDTPEETMDEACAPCPSAASTCLRRDPRAEVRPCPLPTSDTRSLGETCHSGLSKVSYRQGLTRCLLRFPSKHATDTHRHLPHAHRARPLGPPTCPLTRLAANCLMTASTV